MQWHWGTGGKGHASAPRRPLRSGNDFHGDGRAESGGEHHRCVGCQCHEGLHPTGRHPCMRARTRGADLHSKLGASVHASACVMGAHRPLAKRRRRPTNGRNLEAVT